MYEPTKVQVCKDVATRVRESRDIVEATAIIMDFMEYAKSIGYKQGREDECHEQYHGGAVRT